MCADLYTARFILLSISFLYLGIMSVSMVSAACGTYQKVGDGGSVTISSGSNYQAFSNCIWLLEGSSGYQLSVNVTYEGDTNYNRCGDYILISDANDNILLDGRDNCVTQTVDTATAPASWMQVQFISDGVNTTTGFQATISSTRVGSSILNYTNPILGCRSYQWKCPNRVCMTLSYRCDGFNDCGCVGEGCDEDGCEGLPMGKYTIMLVGGCIGVFIFLCFFIFAFAYEVHLRRKAFLNDPEAQEEVKRKKKDKERREAYKKMAKEKKGGRR